MIDKKTLSERDICTKFITPSLEKAGWDTQLQLLEEVEGIENMESMEALQVKPLSDFGSTVEIVNGIFGSREKYLLAIKELENELYSVA